MSSRFIVVLRTIASSGIAGAIAGLLVAGLGGRVVMTIAALLNPEATGLRTENGELIGRLTANGTLALVLFGGLFFGLMAGVVWVVVSPWLPARGIARKLAAMAVGAALGGPLLVRSANRDFVILESDALIVALLLGLVALVALAVAWLDTFLLDRLPHGIRRWPPDRPAASYFALAFLGGVLILPATISTYFSVEVCACLAPRSPLGIALVVVGAATLASWVLWIRGGRETPPRLLILAGRLAVLASVALGTVRVTGEFLRILGRG